MKVKMEIEVENGRREEWVRKKDYDVKRERCQERCKRDVREM